MPDVTMAVALVERRENPLHLRRATGRCREPRSAVLACVDFRLLIPAGNIPLLQVGGVLGPAARFDTGPDSSRVTAGFRNRALEPVMTVRFIGTAAKLAHAASIAAGPAHPDQSRRYAPPHGSRCLADE